MGCFQAIQSQVSKVCIRPALMIRATTTPPFLLAFPEYASQPTPNPSIQLGERGFIAVFEVFKPAPQRRVQRPDDRRKALPVGSLRLGSDRVLEFLHALGSWKALAFTEPIAQELKGIGRCIDDPRLGRMQRKSGFRRPFLH